MGRDIYETRFFDLSLRAVSDEHNAKIKVFTDKRVLEMDAQVSFDTEYAGVSSLDHFLGGLLGGVLLALLEQARHKHVCIEDLEGRLTAKLANPLNLLRVQGYDQAPDLQDLRIVVYVYAEMGEDALFRFCQEALALSPLYNCVKRTLGLLVDVKRLL
ncbi:MAG: hypothetical protein LBF92_08745 [Synergistaceae bacterium]|jgi:hypothetical protein|nr:hypothetical protein [Synergistaceae bacterium]